MQETETPQPKSTEQLVQDGSTLLTDFEDRYMDMSHLKTISEQDRDEHTAIKDKVGLAGDELIDRLGLYVESDYDSRNRHKGETAMAVERLKFGLNAAKEAEAAGFTLDLDDDTLKEVSAAMISDYYDYTEDVQGRSARGELPADYSTRYKAKRQLIESAARELARRMGLEAKGILHRDVAEQVTAESGVPFLAFHRGYEGPIRLSIPSANTARAAGRLAHVGIGAPLVTPYGEVVGADPTLTDTYVVRTPSGKLGRLHGPPRG